MARAVDIAEYILERFGPMSAWKLQKLVYYSQAWNLVWYDAPLFSERIEAWANGPVVRDLYKQHRGEFIVETVRGDANTLSGIEQSTVETVFGHYGRHTAHYLSQLTHLEMPWINARAGVPEGVRSTNEITPDAMHEYYSSLS